MLRKFVFLMAALVLWGCSDESWMGDDKKLDIAGKRISVLTHESKFSKEDMSSVKIGISAPGTLEEWPQAGSRPSHLVGNLAFGKAPALAWQTNIGTGSDYRNRLIAEPVVAGGVVYALDSRGRLSAYDLEGGKRLWRLNLVEGVKDISVVGTGLAYDGGIIYVSTGTGDIAAVDAASREIVWRRSLSAPVRSAASVADGLVYVMTADNRIYALDAKDGREIWQYASIPETTTVLGGASPTVADGIVVSVFASGEIMAFDAKSGTLLWGDAISGTRRHDGLSTLMDIVARPVVQDGTVYIVGYSSIIIALDLKTGDKKWSREISGSSHPLLVNGFIFLITGDTDLVALEAANGRTAWVRELPKYEDEEDKKGRISWQGPLMLDGRLLIVGSYGEMAFLDPGTGKLLSRERVAKSIQIPPVYAKGSLILLNSDADLMVYR